MSSKPDLTAKYEEERVRAHDQSQMAYLQGQIDELRRLLKEQSNKYNWAMEQSRKTESLVTQIQSLFERHTEEIAQSIEISRRDIVGLRKEVAVTLTKVDEFVTPIREMQAQIHRLGETRKLDREQIFARLEHNENVNQTILELQAQIRETEERYRQLTGQLERLREADMLTMQETRRVSEDLVIEKQSLRRQIVETQQLITNIYNEIEDFNARITRTDELLQRTELFAEILPSQISEQAEKLVNLVTDIKRIERNASEHFMMSQERLEDVRRQADERIIILHETDEQHLRQLTSWLERIDSWIRELEQRLNRSINRLETAHEQHIAQIIELERREMRVLNGFAAAFQEQAELTKKDQIEARNLDNTAPSH